MNAILDAMKEILQNLGSPNNDTIDSDGFSDAVNSEPASNTPPPSPQAGSSTDPYAGLSARERADIQSIQDQTIPRESDRERL